MIYDEDRLRRTLDSPAMSRLMQALRGRLRRGRGLGGTITLDGPTQEERSAIDRFLERRPTSGDALCIRVSEIERILREGDICDSLREAIEAITGPVSDERGAREAAKLQWAQVFSSVEPAMTELPIHTTWLEQLRCSGLLKRLCGGDCARAGTLLRAALSVLRELPQPVVPLAEFAARTTGDSHALDAGTPLATLCLLAVALQHGAKAPRSAEARRRLWDLSGIVTDELSAPVLVLNLRPDSSTLVGQWLALMAGAGEPCHLTVRQLRQIDSSAFRPLSASAVHVCENPSVVAAAAHRLGAKSLPLICTAGQPASAAQLLLRLLRGAGCELVYHGDFDPPGIAIANLLHQRFGTQPWRMSAADYSAAATVNGPILNGRFVPAAWDKELTIQMQFHGHAVLEEHVLNWLIADLCPHGHSAR